MLKRLAAPAALVLVLALLLVPVLASAQTASSTSSLIVKLVAGLSPEQQAQVIARNGGVETSSVAALRLHVVEVLASELADVLARYQADPDVASAEENKRRQWEMLPSDALYSSQWALPKIAWDLVYDTVSPTGSAIVALLDSGIDAAHPDLGDKVVAGTSILDGSNGLSDPSGHGTALAGIIAAQTGGAEGIAGVAFAGVRVMPVTVLNANGEGWDSDVIAGVVWAADHGADVILMAFSNPGFSQNLQDAIDYAWSKGVVLVAAVGNNGENAPTFPAGHRGVVGVSATDSADSLASFSNSGTATFLAAPGVDIQTTWIGDSYTVASGTSTSAAMVAGVAAFMKAVDPSLTNGVIVGRMARMADPAGTQEQTGNGRVNMARALVDTSMEEIQPAGADPVGNGGPFVGPYLAASVSSVLITSVSPAAFTSLPASVTVSFNYSTSSGTTTGLAEILGTTASATKSLASGTGKSDSIVIPVPSGTPNGPYNVKVTVTNTTGSGANQKNDVRSGAVVINVDTTPPLITPSISGTAGSNGWYTSDVTVSWNVTDPESGIASSSGCNPTTLTADTAGVTLTCNATNGAGLSSSASVSAKLDKTPPSAALSVTAGTPGTNGWYTSDVTVHTSGTDAISGIASCSADQFQTTETAGQTFNGACTNGAGLVGNASPLTVKLDKTPPTGVALAVVGGTLGVNGWYTSDVTVRTSGTETVSTPLSCTADQVVSTDTAGMVVNGSCTNDAGLSASAASLTVKLDKTPPSAVLSVTAGTPGANGWYTSDVTIHTSGDDPISGITSCSADQLQTTETAGQVLNGSCTNGAGLVGNATPLIVKLDKTPPTGVALAVVAGTLGSNGWYVSDVTVRTSGTESISTPVTCTADQVLTADTTGTVLNGSCTNQAGLTASASPLTVKLDKTPPTIDVKAPANGTAYLLNSVVTSSYACSDATSGVSYCGGPLASGASLNTASVGPKTFTVSATDAAGNSTTVTYEYYVQYAPAGTACLGAPGHQILQPVNADGSSVFKQKSTVPAKFRVCDANGVSIGSAGVVKGFYLYKVVNGTVTTEVSEQVESTNTFTEFRWDPTDQQWIFNMSTKNHTAGRTYYYEIELNDGTDIKFQFGLK